VLGQLEFTDQHTVFVRKNQAVTLFHGDASYWLIPMLGNREEPVKRGWGLAPFPNGACPRLRSPVLPFADLPCLIDKNGPAAYSFYNGEVME
jgi:hypothetical protein